MTEKEQTIAGVGKIAICKKTHWSYESRFDIGTVARQIKCGDFGLVFSRAKNSIKVLIGQDLVESFPSEWFIVNQPKNIKDKSFCITGPLTYTREFYVTLIEALGGTYKKSVVKDLDYLVTNETTATTKRKAANRFNVPIITETEFHRIIFGVGEVIQKETEFPTTIL